MWRSQESRTLTNAEKTTVRRMFYARQLSRSYDSVYAPKKSEADEHIDVSVSLAASEAEYGRAKSTKVVEVEDHQSYGSFPGHGQANGTVEETAKVSGSLAELVEEHRRDEDDKEGDEPSENYELDAEEVDYGHLCTIMCDILCDLATLSSSESWNLELSEKVLLGFRKCCEDDSSKLGEDTIEADIRGLYVRDALTLMMLNLYFWSRRPGFKTLLVTVGCKVHGCGEGKLYQAVTDLLKLDESIRFKELHNGAIISIPLDGREDYSSLGYSLESR